MSTSPKSYRVYCFDGAAMKVSGDEISAQDDAQAIAIVQSRGFGWQCEIWDGDRLVAKLDGERCQA